MPDFEGSNQLLFCGGGEMSPFQAPVVDESCHIGYALQLVRLKRSWLHAEFVDLAMPPNQVDAIEGLHIECGCESRVQTRAHPRLFDQPPFRLVSEKTPESTDRFGRERLATDDSRPSRFTGLLHRGARNYARSRSHVAELSAQSSPRQNHVSNQRLYLSRFKAQISASGADGLSVDPELLRFYSRKRLFRNHTSIHRKPEDPLAIHPTSTCVGFLAGSVKEKYHSRKSCPARANLVY